MSQDQSKTDGAAPVSSTPLLGHPDITSRDLEIEQVERAIANTDIEIRRIEGVLEQMRRKQIGRHCEVIRQKTLARCPNAKVRGGAND